MDQLVGTPSCPHLGFDLQGGRPCCHADDMTRTQCGKFAPNPAARSAGPGSSISGVENYFCTVLGTDSLPPEALKLAAQEKARAKKEAHDAQQSPRYRPPTSARGQLEARPAREQEMSDDQDPVIPTHTIRAEERRIMPNDRCPCGSGKKYKKCCGR
jgi:hypothetical protein